MTRRRHTTAVRLEQELKDARRTARPDATDPLLGWYARSQAARSVEARA